MKRRDFLKLTCKVLAACAIPIPTGTEKAIAASTTAHPNPVVNAYLSKLLFEHNEPKLIHKAHTEKDVAFDGKKIVWRRWDELGIGNEPLIKGIIPNNPYKNWVHIEN